MAHSAQEDRMSSVNHMCPWRGVLVLPGSAGKAVRAASDYAYSGSFVSQAHAGQWVAGKVFLPEFKAGDVYLPEFKAGKTI